MKHYPTTVEIKKKYWPEFSELIQHQLEHGGQKYAFSDEAEWTDIIRDFDDLWVLGTMMKYIGRYKSFGREKDLLKIATYAFLLWLQDGHHLKHEHDEDIIPDGCTVTTNWEYDIQTGEGRLVSKEVEC